jgi:hypothetical protein
VPPLWGRELRVGHHHDLFALRGALSDDPPDFTRGLLFGFASSSNGLNKIMIDGEEVATAEKPLAVPGRWQHLIAQALPDGRLQLFVVDALALQHQARSLPIRPRCPGLWTWATAEFDNVKVYVG